MKKVYICSPYRAENSIQLDRNIDYAQMLTKQALEAGLVPITPHLYIAQCLNEKNPVEREAGLAAGLELLKGCDFVIAGFKYGISDGMFREIQMADGLGIEVVNAVKLSWKLEDDAKQIENKAVEYAKHNACSFCNGSHFHTCTGYDCSKPYQKAYEYAKSHMVQKGGE